MFCASSAAQLERDAPLAPNLPEPIPATEQLRDSAVQQLPQPKSNESEDRRTRSLTHFGHARLLQRHDQLSAAVREYQRAWVWNPDSKQILDELIPLCFRNEQHEVAYRYAKIGLERGWDTLAPLPGIALNAVLEANTEPPWEIYDLAIKTAQEQQADDSLMSLHYDRLRLAFLDESYKVALPSATFLLKALPQPEEYDIDETTKEELWGAAATNYSLIGQVFFDNDQLNLAEQAFRQAAAAQDPNDPPDELAIIHLRLARLHEKQNRQPEAAEELAKYLDAAGSAASLTAYELLERLTEKKPAQFAAELEQQWEVDSRNDALAHLLSEYYLRMKTPRKALPFCEQLAEDERDAPAQNKLLRAYAELKRAGPIVATLGRITKLYGNLDLVEDGVVRITSDKQLYKSVIDETTRRLSKTKRPILWNECLGVALLCFANEEFIDAKKFVQAGISRAAHDPVITGSLFSYGQKLVDIDRFDDAISVFQHCITINPDGEEVNDIRYYLAVAQQLAGDYNAALTTIDQALARSSDSFSLATQRPSVLYAAGRLQEARQACETLIRQFDSGDDDNPVADDDMRAELFATRSMLSAICSEMNDFATAEKWLIEALGEYPNDAGAKNDLGYLWADQGKHLDLARQMIEAAVAEQPDNAAFLDSLGWVLYRMGRAEEAIEPMERAVAGETTEGVLFDHLGDVYHDTGRVVQALGAWRKAKTAFQADEETGKMKVVQDKIDLAIKRQNVAK